MEGVTGMMARLSHMQRVAAGGSAMYRTRVFFSDRVRATVATSHQQSVRRTQQIMSQRVQDICRIFVSMLLVVIQETTTCPTPPSGLTLI